MGCALGRHFIHVADWGPGRGRSFEFLACHKSWKPLYSHVAGVGRVIAPIARSGRKVRTPQGGVVGNAHRG
jgi:hypothetical protein